MPRIEWKTTIVLCGLLASACSGGQKTTKEDVAIGTDTIRLDVATVTNTTPEGLVEKLRTDCGPSCSVVWVDIAEDTPLAAGQKAIDAARALETPPRVVLVPPSAKEIEVDVRGAEPCAEIISVQSDGIFVTRDGQSLPPDPDCDVWTATACRLEDGAYDWPRVRTAIGDPDQVCLHLADGATLGQLESVAETFTRPIVRFEQPPEQQAAVSPDAVKSAFEGAAGDLEWCYEGEVNDRVPMSLVIQMLVAVDGTIERAAAKDGVRTTPQFEECLVGVAEKFELDSPGDSPVVVEQKLKFSPDASPPMTLGE